MITRHTYIRTYDRDGQRIRDDITQWRLFGLLPVFTQRREVWKKPAPIAKDMHTIPPVVTATIVGRESKIIFSRAEQIAFSDLMYEIIERYGDDSAVPFGDIGIAIENGSITTAEEVIMVLQAMLDETEEDEPLLAREVS